MNNLKQNVIDQEAERERAVKSKTLAKIDELRERAWREHPGQDGGAALNQAVHILAWLQAWLGA